MGERILKPENMATTSTAVSTAAPQTQEETPPRVTVITLRAPQTSATKRVAWTEDTVDNEEMNKKKSKCCCIYEKPRKFDESSSSESDDECEHCFGHVERRKKHHHDLADAPTSAESTQTQVETGEMPQPEPTYDRGAAGAYYMIKYPSPRLHSCSRFRSHSSTYVGIDYTI